MNTQRIRIAALAIMALSLMNPLVSMAQPASTSGTVYVDPFGKFGDRMQLSGTGIGCTDIDGDYVIGFTTNFVNPPAVSASGSTENGHDHLEVKIVSVESDHFVVHARGHGNNDSRQLCAGSWINYSGAGRPSPHK
jgi:hypothetical protein